MAYPSTIASFPTHVDGQVIEASDINNIQTEVVAIETFVGTISSVAGSLENDIRNPLSSGGGHIQAANTGGTGQISYNKGDILVASSNSVLSKLGIGSDGTSPIADSTQTQGIKWGNISATLPYSPDSGTGSVYALYPTPAITTYTQGAIFVTQIANSNTVISPALSVSSLVAQKIINLDGSSVLSGQIPSSTLAMFGYSSVASAFQLLNPNPIKGLGTWVSANTDGLAHKVLNDSFLVVTATNPSAGFTLTLLSDSSNPPTTARSTTVTAAAGYEHTATIPVRKNDYYISSISGGSAGQSGYLIPLS